MSTKKTFVGANFREVVITNTAGVATVYAGDGGIIMTL